MDIGPSYTDVGSSAGTVLHDRRFAEEERPKNRPGQSDYATRHHCHLPAPVTCPACNGTGLTAADTNCRRCKGNGSTGFNPRAPCPFPRGSEQRIAWYQARYNSGTEEASLFHPLDHNDPWEPEIDLIAAGVAEID